MRYLPPVLGVLVVIASIACAAPVTELFNGRDFTGWEFVTTPAVAITKVCHLQPDGSIAVTGKPVGFIATTPAYENYQLHAEWRWPDQPGNSGVLIHISSGPKDRAWPVCIQIQLKNKNVGDVLPMAGAAFAEKPSTPPEAKTAILNRTAPDSEKPVGEWNSCDLTCRGDILEVTINGVVQNKVTQLRPHSGRIGFQLEGIPFELRRVSVVRLD